MISQRISYSEWLALQPDRSDTQSNREAYEYFYSIPGDLMPASEVLDRLPASVPPAIILRIIGNDIRSGILTMFGECRVVQLQGFPFERVGEDTHVGRVLYRNLHSLNYEDNSATFFDRTGGDGDTEDNPKWCRVWVSDVKFSFAEIEPYIVPFGNRSNDAKPVVVPISPRPKGAPRRYDWDGVFIHLIREANINGLPEGPGAQAEIERIIATWFMETSGSEPATSTIRTYAQRIVDALSGRR